MLGASRVADQTLGLAGAFLAHCGAGHVIRAPLEPSSICRPSIVDYSYPIRWFRWIGGMGC